MRSRAGAGFRALLVGVLLFAAGSALAAPLDAPLSRGPQPLPDNGAFDLLLFHLARPVGDKPRGLVVNDVNLALVTGSAGLLPLDEKGAVASWQMLRGPALDAQVSELPRAERLVTLLAPESNLRPTELRMRDLGQLLAGTQGPMHRFTRGVFGAGATGELLAGAVGSVAAFGVARQLGTGQAQMLGLNPALTGTTLGGRFFGSLGLRCERRFQNAFTDGFARLVLYKGDGSNPVRDMAVEGGLTYAYDKPAEERYPSRWMRLRASSGVVDGALGAHLTGADPNAWADADTTLQGGPLRLRLAFSRQNATALHQVTGTLIGRPREDVLAGLFYGMHSAQGFIAGVMTMTTF